MGSNETDLFDLCKAIADAFEVKSMRLSVVGVNLMEDLPTATVEFYLKKLDGLDLKKLSTLTKDTGMVIEVQDNRLKVTLSRTLTSIS